MGIGSVSIVQSSGIGLRLRVLLIRIASSTARVGNQEVAFKLPYGQSPTRKKKNRYETNKYARRYRAKLVIGTSIVFDYGYQYNQIFDSQNRPKSSYSIYRVADRSMTSRCVSVIDDLHIAILSSVTLGLPQHQKVT